MLRILILLGMGVALAWALQKEHLVVHAPLLPKMAMMQYGFEKSIQNGTICVTILYDKADESMARFMVNAVQVSVVKNYQVCARMVPYEALKEDEMKAQLYYLMPTSAATMRAAIAELSINSHMSFAYDWRDLAYGATLSVRTLSHVKPILNLEAAQASNIALRAPLIKISDIFGHHE